MSHRNRRRIPGAPASSPARARGLQSAGEDPPSRNFGEAGAGAPGKLAEGADGSVIISEFLILSDGTVLAHNLTPAMADVLRTLNPKDHIMSRRAQRLSETMQLNRRRNHEIH